MPSPQDTADHHGATAVAATDRHQMADATRPEPVVNTGGHYHLDPAAVTVDRWQILDEQHHTRSTTDPTVHAARSRIGDGLNYPWLHITRAPDT
ncbi:hypothetical protein SAMN05443287_102249 [Micromonospora phaseoli]|uniref:Uncharacterized protein n=1 Tax=Micromonospora phaseoli TaxID=1144548 RepID=A0A1H6ULL0_9ACTN|nr:hypothetical protein [Micromonospora phaseoli]PZV99013.1 hypothetical protein CLV64_104250 [Micromonospora phaseoli]GIJ76234.1 hypothetical protein Xph01_06660 [Micromonospora phaseoli]SEI91604.1 hypothetical protein SAMN05443287_102249 [Micromonospora phaseoli]